MKTRLDPDSLGIYISRENDLSAGFFFPGIILLPGFLDEFFPEETHGPDTFSLFHYNGLVRGEASQAYIKGESRKYRHQV